MGFTITNGYYDGGGIFCYGFMSPSSPTIKDCIISGNTAPDRGGGIYCLGLGGSSSPTIEDCVISGNTCNEGAGISVGEYGTPIIDNCQVTDNSGTGIFTLHNMGTSVIDSTISRNTEGGILCSEGSITIDGCVLVENTENYHGGAISLEFSFGDSVIQNSIISGNTTSVDGGAICCFIGGGCTVTVTNCTIAGNTAANYGGAIRTGGDPGSVLQVYNSILYGNIAGNGNEIAIPFAPTNAVTISYCDIEGGYPAVFNPDAVEVQWYGNIDVDPNFVASGYWDNGNWVDGDYHLRSQAGRWDTNSQSWVLDDVTSSCIDAGNPGCLPGEEPVDENNVRINIGAYGGTVEASKTPAGWGLLADLTNNWAVEMRDFAGLAADWHRIGDEQPGDLDRSDMTVNISDLVLFAGGWLEVRTIEGP